jgi:FixJ family two-component response regulator
MASLLNFSKNAIMIVDDTESMALCVKAFLQAMGYAGIETFGCPGKALDEIRERGCPGFIITDYEMPAMTGAALLDSVVQLYPLANGVIMTCHREVPSEVAARFNVIRKDGPDFFGRLLRHVREELASESSCP